MSSRNTNVNGGPTMGGKMGMDSAMGKDTSMHACNTIDKCGSNPPEYSPSATKHSPNRYKKGKGGKGKY